MTAREVADMKARWAAEDAEHRAREEALRERQREVRSRVSFLFCAVHLH